LTFSEKSGLIFVIVIGYQTNQTEPTLAVPISPKLNYNPIYFFFFFSLDFLNFFLVQSLHFTSVGRHLYVNLFPILFHARLRSPFLSCHIPLLTMSSSTHFSDPSSFQQQSNEFISWLESNPGVKANQKILLADLRSSGAGRGVGKLTAKPPPPTTQNPHPGHPKEIHERINILI
jgi:hypothetical protein